MSSQKIPDRHRLGSYMVSVKTFAHYQFQCYVLYGFRVRASQNVDFLAKFRLIP